jgi:hypothetical protein
MSNNEPAYVVVLSPSVVSPDLLTKITVIDHSN